VLHAFASHEKARLVFGGSEPVGLEEGIGRMVDWAKQHGPRQTPPFSGVELWTNFPEAWRDAVDDSR